MTSENIYEKHLIKDPPQLKKEDYEFIDNFINQKPEDQIKKLRELGWYQESEAKNIPFNQNNNFYNDIRQNFSFKELYLGPGLDIIRILLNISPLANIIDVNTIVKLQKNEIAIIDNKKINGYEVFLNGEGGIALARMYARQVNEGRIAENFNLFSIRWNIAKVSENGITIFFKVPAYREDWHRKQLRLIVTKDNDEYTKLETWSLHYNLMTAFLGLKKKWSIDKKSKNIIMNSILSLPEKEVKSLINLMTQFLNEKELNNFIQKYFGKNVLNYLNR